MALNYMSTQLVEALKVAREYFGPEAEHWLDDEVVHRLMIRALDLQRQLDEARHDRPPRRVDDKKESKDQSRPRPDPMGYRGRRATRL